MCKQEDKVQFIAASVSSSMSTKERGTLFVWLLSIYIEKIFLLYQVYEAKSETKAYN